MCWECGSDYASDSDLTDLDTDSEDSSSQCGEISSPGEAPSEDSPDKQPATKRARVDKGTDTGTAPAAKGSGRKKKTPGLIVTVPTDILLRSGKLLASTVAVFLTAYLPCLRWNGLTYYLAVLAVKNVARREFGR
jgi:hypothetical protein